MVHLLYGQLTQLRTPPVEEDAKSLRIAIDFGFETFCSIGTHEYFNFPPEFFQSSTLKALINRFVGVAGYERVAVACDDKADPPEKHYLPIQTLAYCGAVASFPSFFYMRLLISNGF